MNKIAHPRVEGKALKTMTNTDVRGTAKIAPAIPHKDDHNESETNITKGERFICRPIIFGSNQLPTKNCAIVNNTVKNNESCSEANCTKDNTTGNSTPIKEPT